MENPVRFARRALGFVSAVAAGAATLSPALAADPAQLDCILRAVPDADRAVLARTLTGQSRDDAAEAPLGRAMEQCRRTLGWSDEDARSASLFAVGTLAQSEIRRRLAALGVDAAELERAVLSDAMLIEELEASLATGNVTTGFPARNDALIARLTGTRPGDRELAGLIGAFVGFRGMMELGRRRYTGH
jgi:hypothetical protein